jgi:tetratricopeptide (TPR) repeat protein
MKYTVHFYILLLLFSWGCASTVNIPEPVREYAPITALEELRIFEGIEHHGKGEYDQAIAVYEGLLERNPHNVLALYEISYSLHAKGEYKRSIEYALQALEYDSEYRAMLYTIIGNNLDMMGKPKQAVLVYKEGIGKYPGEFMLHYNLAIAYIGMNKQNEAESEVIEAIRANNRHASSHMVLAEIYRQRGEQIPALLMLCRFLVLEPATMRSVNAIRDIDQLVQWGVQRKDEKNVTINLFGFDDDSPYGAMILLLRLKQAALSTELRELNSPVRARVETLDMLFSLIAEKSDRSTGDFTADYLFPYYAGLAQNELSEAFIYYIHQSAGNSEIDTWIDTNMEAIERFLEWNQKYEWQL